MIGYSAWWTDTITFQMEILHLMSDVQHAAESIQANLVAGKIRIPALPLLN